MAVLLKTGTGLVLVGVLAAGDQVDKPLTALLLGAASTNLLVRAAEQVPLPNGGSTIPARTTSSAMDDGTGLISVGSTGPQVSQT